MNIRNVWINNLKSKLASFCIHNANCSKNNPIWNWISPFFQDAKNNNNFLYSTKIPLVTLNVLWRTIPNISIKKLQMRHKIFTRIKPLITPYLHIAASAYDNTTVLFGNGKRVVKNKSRSSDRLLCKSTNKWAISQNIVGGRRAPSLFQTQQ